VIQSTKPSPLSAGVTDNISPRARSEHYPDYYAAAVFDPDGYFLRKKLLCLIQEVTLPFNKRRPKYWYNLRDPEPGTPSVNFSVAILA
jgi:hypothetical protein